MGKRNGANTREELLDVATRLYAERGVHGASLRDIGGVVGIANASILHHFPSKGHLYAAVLRRIAAGLEEALSAADGAKGKDAKRLARLYHGLFDWCVANPLEMRVIVREMMDRANPEDPDHQWMGTILVDRLAGSIAKAQKSGHLKKCHPVVTAHSMVGAIVVYMLTLNGTDVPPKPSDIEAYREESFRHLARAAIVKKQK